MYEVCKHRKDRRDPGGKCSSPSLCLPEGLVPVPAVSSEHMQQTSALPLQPPHVGPPAHTLISLLVSPDLLENPLNKSPHKWCGEGLLPSLSLLVCAPGKCQLCPVSPPHVGHLVSVLQTVSCLPDTSSLRTASAISLWLWQWPQFSTLFLCWGNSAFS